MGRRTGVGGATKSVAVKFIIPSKTNSERHREMFLSEARLSMMLSHSNVIQVFDAGEDDGRLYMVMEWVDGMNLAQLLAHMRNEGKLPSLSLGGFVIGEILKGLAYAHNLYHEGRQITIVHRDISPQNVLVSVSGEVKLLDFGVARLAQEETSGIHIKGKLRYMAPEHLGGSSKAPTVDIYGAGAILHELVEGAKFRAGADEMQLYNQILGGQTPALSRADTPPELAALRATMLDPDENRRVPSADDALEMLENWTGYRSAAGELGRMVRGYMGVNTPRSGIHMHAASRSVDAHADTSPPTAATNTRQTGATSPEVSASMPGVGTDPSVPPMGAMAQAGSGPLVVHQKKGPPALLLGVGAGLLCAAGAVGVVVAMRGGDEAPTEHVAAAEAPSAPSEADEPPPEADEPPAEDAPALAEPLQVGEEAPPQPAPAPEPEPEPEPAEAEPSGEAAADAPESKPAATSSRSRRGSKSGRSNKSGRSSKPSEPATATPAAPRPAPKAKPKMKVTLKLKAPLKLAYVRIDGGKEIVLEPMKRMELTVGEHSIMWRPNRDQPFVQSRKVKLVAGGKTTIRITNNGARLE